MTTHSSTVWKIIRSSTSSFWTTVHGPDWCRGQWRGFSCPVFPALGTSVRLAALTGFLLPPPPSLLLSPLSLYTSGLRQRGQMSLSWDSASPFVIAEPDDWSVCEKERGESERAGGHSVCDWFSEGVWGDQEWVRSRLGSIKIATTTWEITACLSDTPHLYWARQEMDARGNCVCLCECGWGISLWVTSWDHMQGTC